MVTPELQKYVETEKQRGVTTEALRTVLQSQGWPQADIDAVVPAEVAPAVAEAPAIALPETPPVEEKSVEELKTESDKHHRKVEIALWSGIAVLALALIAGGAYIFLAQPSNQETVSPSPTAVPLTTPTPSPSVSPTPSNPATINVTSQTTGKQLLSYTLPDGWNQEAYYPQGTGSPIALFPTSADKQSSAFSVASVVDVSSNKLFRAVVGTVLANKPGADLTAYDRMTVNNPHYDKLLLENGTFTGGSYRCQQVKDGSALGVNCYVSNNGTLLNYVLHTTLDNYLTDVQALYAVIESTVVSQ